MPMHPENAPHENDDRFRKQGAMTPIVFFVIFIIFVYGGLLVGLLGAAEWFMNSYDLNFFKDLGDWGVFLVVVLFLAVWILSVLLIAGLAYLIVLSMGHPIKAKKAAVITMFLLFNVLSMPWILWPMIKQNLRS